MKNIKCNRKDIVAQKNEIESLWSKPFCILLILAFCDYVVGQGMNSCFAVYVTKINETTYFAGVLTALFSLSAGVTRFAFGHLVVQYTKRKLLILSFALLLVGTIIPLIVPNAFSLIMCRILQGVGFALGTTTASSAVADILPMMRMGEGLGIFGLGQAIALCVGPFLALFLVDFSFSESVFVGFAVFCIAGLFFACRCKYESNPTMLPKTSSYWIRSKELKDAGTSQKATDKGLSGDKKNTLDLHTNTVRTFLGKSFETKALAGAIPSLLMCPAFSFCLGFSALLGVQNNIPFPALLYFFSAVGMLLIRVLSKYYLDSVAPLGVFIFATAATLISLACLFLLSLLSELYYVAGLFYGIGLGISTPLNQSVAIKNTPSDRWPQANALFYLLFDVGFTVCYCVHGLLIDAYGFQCTIGIVMTVTLFAIIAAWITYPQHGLKVLQARYK